MKTKAKLLLIIFLRTIYLHIYFKLNSFNKILNKFSNLTSADPTINVNPFKAAKLIRLILQFIFFSKNCFHRSFVSAAILKSIGIKVKLIIGVSLIDSFKSHAWIEINGTPILENGNLNKYQIIYKA
jgi:hypothetical protein